jgi:hypothetical protein
MQYNSSIITLAIEQALSPKVVVGRYWLYQLQLWGLEPKDET